LLTGYEANSTPCLYNVFRQQVKLNPDKIAIKYNTVSLTYSQLDNLSLRIARYIESGIVDGPIAGRVVIALPRDPYAIASILATQRLGLTYVPFDPSGPDERLNYIIEDCQPALVITRKAEAKRQGKCYEIYIEDLPEDISSTVLKSTLSAEAETAYIMYTSGSTGQPKGVMVPRKGVLNLVVDAHPFQFSTDAIIAQCGNIAFDASTFEIWGALLNGCTLIIVPYEVVINSAELSDLLRRENISDAFFTVALFNQLVAENPNVFCGLKNVLTGGDALNPASVLAALSAESPPAAIWNAYGPTENTVITTLHRIQLSDCHRSSIPIGRSISGTQCYVLDNAMRPVADGEEGELYTSGLGLANGYLNKADKTSEAFLTNPFYTQEREFSPESASQTLYKTGDRVRRLAEGSLDFLGRMDNQIKIRGFRLEPGEVEFRLCQLPGVELAVVQPIVVEGQKQLAAWCQGSGSPQQLLSLFREQVPAYMVPVSLQLLDKLPLTPNGKVDKRRLPAAEINHHDYEPVQSITESWLEKVWQEILKLEKVPGRKGHFFWSGGHSLLVVKLRHAIYEHSGKEISLASLFRFPVLHEMAAHIDSQSESHGEHLFPVVPPGSRTTLSLEQNRLWLTCCREPDVAHYSIPLAFRIIGSLDSNRLQVALRKLSERHHSLRLRIYETQGLPWQKVVETPATLTTVSVPQESDLAAKINDEVARPFRFGDESLLRTTLYCVEGQPRLLLINIHHIIADGWSMGIFFEELKALYDGETVLSGLACQYPDYCAWQQQQDFQPQIEGWKTALEGVTPLALPVSGTPQPGSIMRKKVLPSRLLNQLQSTAIASQSGLFNLVFSGLALLLSRICQQQDVPICGIWANRPQQSLSNQIGFFANTLIMRTQVDERNIVGDWLRDNHRTLTQGFERGEAPLGQVLAATGIPSGPTQHPLCAVLLVLQNTQGGDGKTIELNGCEFSDYPLQEEQAKSDLLLNVVPQTDGQLRLEATFRKGIWPEILMDTLLDLYQAILEKLTEDLQQPLSALFILNDAMRYQQLVEWNPSLAQQPNQAMLPMFEHWVSQQPDKLAVRCQSESMTYSELDQRANQFAAGLQSQRGQLRGKRVAFAFDRGINTVAIMLAIAKTGASYVPFDPSHPNDRLRYMLTDSAADCLIVNRNTAGRQDICPEILVDALSSGGGQLTPVSHHADDEAYVMYTSGSTGEPKGVKVLQRGVTRLVVNAEPWQITADAVIAQAGNIAFDASTLEIWGALLNGAQIEVIPYEIVIDSEKLQQTLVERGVTDAWFTVALFNQLAADNPNAFAGLRNLLIGGDALTPSLVDNVLSSATPPAQIWNGYGPTENTTFTTLYPIRREDCQGASIPIGSSISGTTCYVLDAQQRLLPPGAIGTLYTSGAGLADGYLNKMDKTEEAFIDNPFFEETRQRTPATQKMYKTGDRVRWKRNGILEFIGRGDNQVKIRGYRLEPGEVEHLLCQLAGVRQAVVIAMEHQGQKQLAAWCVSELDTAEILNAFTAVAPAYMVPAALQTIKKIPLTANGKVDKSQLPAVDFAATLKEGTPPQGETELQLALIWQQLLQTDRPCVREDNFFMIGGHSLLVIKMTDLIQKLMAKSVPVATVFRCRSLAELAASLDGKTDGNEEDEAQLIARDVASTQMTCLSASRRQFETILLTGASGFLGIHLLADLQRKRPEANVHCLVRGKEGVQRLLEAADLYQLTLDPSRIHTLCGDLDAPCFGLSSVVWEALGESIDAIYHCGAWVNHLHSYTTLRAANVESTRQLLELCTFGRPKHFFYVSTLSAAATEGTCILEKTVAQVPPMQNGYVQGKWASEQLVTQAFANGLHGAIFRMGNITGSVRNGISNVETNHTLNLIKGCLQMGVAPNWKNYELDISPVDCLADLLVNESLEGRYDQQAINLGYLSAIPWTKLLSIIAGGDHAIHFVSSDVWAQQWVPGVGSDNALYPFKSFYLDAKDYPRMQIEHSLVAEMFGALDADQLIAKYREYWFGCGFLTTEIQTSAEA
jgi:amino acid adenylation domain-containing protein/thioester reductase-like protein